MDRNVNIIIDLNSKKIFISRSFPDEYADSESRLALKGLLRHDADGRKYLYDLLAIKKETSSPLE